MAFRRRVSVLGLGLAALCLASCETVPTQWMPNGYRYQDDTPLSSPAPSRPWRKDAAHPDLEKMGDRTAAWQGAVYELISPLPQAIPATAAPITLQAQSSVPENAEFDHYLRQALLSQGYTVNPSPDNKGAVLVYDASRIRSKESKLLVGRKFGSEFLKKGDFRNMDYLTLDILGADGKPVSRYETIAVLPDDGKKKSSWSWGGGSVRSDSADKKAIYQTRE